MPLPFAAELPVHEWACRHAPQGPPIKEVPKGLEVVRLLQHSIAQHKGGAVMLTHWCCGNPMLVATWVQRQRQCVYVIKV